MLTIYLLYPTQPGRVTTRLDLRSVCPSMLPWEFFSSFKCMHFSINQAESVSHNLGVPVLRHSSMKPSHRTIAAIQRYFNSIPSPVSDPVQLIVIGDRLLTDIVLANRLGAYSILVSRDWAPTIKSRVTGVAERAAMTLARWLHSSQRPSNISGFIKEVLEQKGGVKLSYSGSTWTWAGRALGIGPNSGKYRRCS